ncbi:hypothetical protein [Reyranella sp.]|uniref:hypothetical protein n=1 Tax=Reyranella sp. TaxID=1929291 RepID=UPI003D103A68
MTDWIISYRHWSYDRIGQQGKDEPGFHGEAMEITDVHPARWLWAAALRYSQRARSAMQPGESFRRVTKVVAILSAVEIPDGTFNRQERNELEDLIS